LPGYIGFSTREGSGVFDPIKRSGNEYIFYHLGECFQINVQDLKSKISDNKGSVLLLIHYFGFVDEKINEIRLYAQENNVVVVDDCAHAYFTFMNGCITNYQYALFSLHKMFPVNDGGALLINNGEYGIECEDGANTDLHYKIAKYNIGEITRIRIRNYNHILDKLKDYVLDKNITIIYPDLNCNIPQTFPLLFENHSVRDTLYFALNKEGFGVVSLYHELISCLPNTFIVENDYSDRILNLPVHQDISIEEMDKLLDCLIGLICANSI